MRLHKPRPFFLDPSFIASNMESYSDLFLDNIFQPNNDDDDDEELDDDSSWKPEDASSRCYATARAVIDEAIANRIRLQRFNGLKILHDGAKKVFVDGKALTLARPISSADEPFFDHHTIDAELAKGLSDAADSTMLR